VILYLDASALVKRYVAEFGSGRVNRAIAEASLAGTAVISRAEVGAALAKAVRIGVLSEKDGQTSAQAFRDEWTNLVRIPVSEAVVARADGLAWVHDLRGYDAVHLAAALQWRDLLAAPIAMATFDRRLWAAAGEGLGRFPEDLPELLDELSGRR